MLRDAGAAAALEMRTEEELEEEEEELRPTDCVERVAAGAELPGIDRARFWPTAGSVARRSLAAFDLADRGSTGPRRSAWRSLLLIKLAGC